MAALPIASQLVTTRNICNRVEVRYLARNLSAEKNDRQGEKRRLRNKMIKSRAKTLVKDFVELVDEKKKDEAQKKLDRAVFLPRQGGLEGVYHRNTAARKKSRMHHLLGGLKA